jgi:hypothetical protein
MFLLITDFVFLETHSPTSHIFVIGAGNRAPISPDPEASI